MRVWAVLRQLAHPDGRTGFECPLRADHPAGPFPTSFAGSLKRTCQPLTIYGGGACACLWRGDQTSTCCNNPTITPQNNRIDCSKSRDAVASCNLPDAIGSLQHSPSISNLPYYPAINGSRLCFRKRGRMCFRFVADGG